MKTKQANKPGYVQVRLRHARLLNLLASFAAALLVLRIEAADLDPVMIGRWSGPEGGETYGVEVRDGHAYCATSLGLQVLDIRLPENPRLVGSFSPGGRITHFKIAGSRGYAVEHRDRDEFGGPSSDTILVLDVANPAQPIQLGKLLFWEQTLEPNGISDFAEADGYLHIAIYTVRGGGWVQVIDARDSANLKNVGRYEVPEDHHWLSGIAVSGNHAYLFSHSDRFNVFDVSKPENVTLVGQVAIERMGGTIAIQGNFAYVAGYGLQVVDISVPESPRLVGRYDSMDSEVRGIAVLGNVVVYGFAPGNGIKVIDVSSPTNPRLVGSITSDLFGTWGSRSGLALSGDKLFVAAAEQGVVVFQIPSLSLRLGPLPQMDPDSFRFSLTGPVGQSARVERSENLRDWQDWRTVTLGAAPLELTDSIAEPRRFYRAVSP